MSCVGPYYQQHYLLFLPFMAMFGGKIIETMTQEKRRHVQILFVSFFIIFFGMNYKDLLVTNFQHIRNKTNRKQIEFLNYIDQITAPNESILYFWSKMGGYVFRPHLHYYWYMDDFSQSLVRAIEGRNIYSDDLLKTLKKEKIKTIILDKEELSFLPLNLKIFILKNINIFYILSY